MRGSVDRHPLGQLLKPVDSGRGDEAREFVQPVLNEEALCLGLRV